MDQLNSTGTGTSVIAPASATSKAHTYKRVCSHCRHQTTASRPGIIACKWGGCSGTVHAS